MGRRISNVIASQGSGLVVAIDLFSVGRVILAILLAFPPIQYNSSGKHLHHLVTAADYTMVSLISTAFLVSD